MSRVIQVPQLRPIPQTGLRTLNKSDGFVTAADGTANVLTAIWTWLIEHGRAIRIPGRFFLGLRLQSDASTQLPDDAQFCLGYYTRDDTVRLEKVGELMYYKDWADLDTASKQNDTRMNGNLVVDLGGDVLTVEHGERLVLAVLSSAVADETYCNVRIPYEETTPHAVQDDLAYRRIAWGS